MAYQRYRGSPPPGPRPGTLQRQPRDSAPYHVVCISLFDGDLAALDEAVDALKRAGTRCSRSAYIRAALAAFTANNFAPEQANPAPQKKRHASD